jgi:hypothetical protein
MGDVQGCTLRSGSAGAHNNFLPPSKRQLHGDELAAMHVETGAKFNQANFEVACSSTTYVNQSCPMSNKRRLRFRGELARTISRSFTPSALQAEALRRDSSRGWLLRFKVPQMHEQPFQRPERFNVLWMSRRHSDLVFTSLHQRIQRSWFSRLQRQDSCLDLA